jgi:L,D-transpeptidase ErfK/SrfK
MEEGILINVPQRLLFLFDQGRIAAWYPVGLGRPDWQTPLGSFHVLSKEHDPTWDVPVSIQREMKKKGARVRTRVPPGPENPLGRHWLGLSASGCGIHGTNAPTSIYRFGTHGCIRLHPEDVADLFGRVSIGIPVEIVYEPILLGRDERGTVFLEVHPDVYRREGDPLKKAGDLAREAGLENAAGSPRWGETVRSREGVAVPVASDSSED